MTSQFIWPQKATHLFAMYTLFFFLCLVYWAYLFLNIVYLFGKVFFIFTLCEWMFCLHVSIYVHHMRTVTEKVGGEHWILWN